MRAARCFTSPVRTAASSTSRTSTWLTPLHPGSSRASSWSCPSTRWRHAGQGDSVPETGGQIPVSDKQPFPQIPSVEGMVSGSEPIYLGQQTTFVAQSHRTMVCVERAVYRGAFSLYTFGESGLRTYLQIKNESLRYFTIQPGLL